MNWPVRALVTTGSVVSVGFGVWHFFVPAWWAWYSYIDPSATELVIAVRAINAFFSLSLVLFGAVNVLLVWRKRPDKYSMGVLLAAACALWATRVAFQIAYPQGSARPILQYAMLATFAAVLACYAASLVIVASGEVST